MILSWPGSLRRKHTEAILSSAIARGSYESFVLGAKFGARDVAALERASGARIRFIQAQPDVKDLLRRARIGAKTWTSLWTEKTAERSEEIGEYAAKRAAARELDWVLDRIAATETPSAFNQARRESVQESVNQAAEEAGSTSETADTAADISADISGDALESMPSSKSRKEPEQDEEDETESTAKADAETDTEAEAKAARLDPDDVEREWVCEIDACDACRSYAGQTATLNGDYPCGYEPGEVHPHCRCSETITTVH